MLQTAMEIDFGPFFAAPAAILWLESGVCICTLDTIHRYIIFNHNIIHAPHFFSLLLPYVCTKSPHMQMWSSDQFQPHTVARRNGSRKPIGFCLFSSGTKKWWKKGVHQSYMRRGGFIHGNEFSYGPYIKLMPFTGLLSCKNRYLFLFEQTDTLSSCAKRKRKLLFIGFHQSFQQEDFSLL